MSRMLLNYRTLFLASSLALLVFPSAPLLAQKGGKKPPKDDSPPGELPSYQVELLGTLGGDWSQALEINERGDILGHSETGETVVSDDGPIPVEERFVYFRTADQMYTFDVLIRTEDLEKYKLGSPRAMNSSGQFCTLASSNETNEFEGVARISVKFDDAGMPLLGRRRNAASGTRNRRNRHSVRRHIGGRHQ